MLAPSVCSVYLIHHFRSLCINAFLGAAPWMFNWDWFFAIQIIIEYFQHTRPHRFFNIRFWLYRYFAWTKLAYCARKMWNIINLSVLKSLSGAKHIAERVSWWNGTIAICLNIQQHFILASYIFVENTVTTITVTYI